jgi:RimJ/RimL family protein N-acetyltransferase
MGSCLIERTFDAELIRRIVTRPDMWATVAEDGFSADEWTPDMAECWLRVTSEGELIGLYNFHVVDDDVLQIHPMILVEHRGPIAYESGREVLKWVFANSGYQKVVCMIPEIYRNVILFAMRCGMVKTDKVKRIYQKNGKIYDMVTLAVSRSEIEATL